MSSLTLELAQQIGVVASAGNVELDYAEKNARKSIAALIALDAPPASYLWQVSNALDAGATPNEAMSESES